MSYEKDRVWADQFIPQIKAIIGPHLIEPADLEPDIKQATDLMVLKGRDMRIGCRLRRHQYYKDYPRDFTIRLKRDSGAQTELAKIVAGWGDWLFYGHVNKAEDEILHAMIVDLNSFRLGYHMARNKDIRIRSGKAPNQDGTHLAWFDVDSFPSHPPLLVAEYHAAVA